jgi:hypothetical protein
LRRRRRLGDELRQVILQESTTRQLDYFYIMSTWH